GNVAGLPPHPFEESGIGKWFDERSQVSHGQSPLRDRLAAMRLEPPGCVVVPDGVEEIIDRLCEVIVWMGTLQDLGNDQGPFHNAAQQEGGCYRDAQFARRRYVRG